MVYCDHAQRWIPSYLHQRSWMLERSGDIFSTRNRVLLSVIGLSLRIALLATAGRCLT